MGDRLIQVVILRSLDWTMDLAVPPNALFSGVALARGAAEMAGLSPAFQFSRALLAIALRAK